MVYRLNVAEKEVVETQDVVCLLKDEKELYIQKDHLSSKLEICRFVPDRVLVVQSGRKQNIFLSYSEKKNCCLITRSGVK